jgi:hypothetical protein
MLNLNKAAETAALNDALRACRDANERLAAILAGQTATSHIIKAIESVPDARGWLKAPDVFAVKGGVPFAKVPSSRANTTCVYVAGCEGLRTLSKDLQLPLFKIGSSGNDILNRVAQLNADRYAGGYRENDKLVIDPGFDCWKFMTMDYTLPRSSGSPLRIEPCALRVKLPKSMSRRQFEGQLRKELAPISLAHWLKTEGSQLYLATRNLSLARVKRYTACDLGDSVRLSPADEIYIFRHRSEMARLCRLCELIAQEAPAA